MLSSVYLLATQHQGIRQTSVKHQMATAHRHTSDAERRSVAGGASQFLPLRAYFMCVYAVTAYI